VNEPQGEKYYGGQVAAPIFKELGREILTYLEIPPSRSNLEDESREDPVPTADSILRESNEDPLPQWPDEPLHPEVAPAIEQAIEEMPDWINLASRNEELTAQRTLAGSSTVQEVPVSGVLRTDEFVNMLIAEEGR